MFGSHKVKIEGELLDKVRQCAEACGYSSLDEFVLHALEKEVNRVLPPSEGGSTSKEIIKKRLQGLGYIEYVSLTVLIRLWALLESTPHL